LPAEVLQQAEQRIATVAQAANDSIAALPAGSSLEKKLETIHAAILKNFTTRSTSVGYAEPLAKGAGDCDVTSLLFYEICKSNGMDARLVILTPLNGEGHMFVAVHDGTRVIAVETQATRERHQLLFSSELALVKFSHSQSYDPSSVDGGFPFQEISAKEAAAFTRIERECSAGGDDALMNSALERWMKEKNLPGLPQDRPLRDIIGEIAQRADLSEGERRGVSSFQATMERVSAIAEQEGFQTLTKHLLWTKGIAKATESFDELSKSMMLRWKESVATTLEGQTDNLCTQLRAAFLENGFPCRAIRLPEGGESGPRIALICDHSLRRMELDATEFAKVGLQVTPEGRKMVMVTVKNQGAPIEFHLDEPK
jgi:hypothetical protein